MQRDYQSRCIIFVLAIHLLIVLIFFRAIPLFYKIAMMPQ